MKRLDSPPAGTTRGLESGHAIGPLVSCFFELLDEDGLAWAVLRGGDGLPDDTAYDIDLLVQGRAVRRVEGVLDRAAALHGWRKLRIMDKYQYCCCLLVSPNPRRRFLAVDLVGGCYHRFYPFADANYALRYRSRNAKGVWVVPPGFGAAVTLIKELMRHDRFKDSSRSETQAGALGDRESFITGVAPYLGEDVASRLLEACRGAEWEQVEALAPAVRRDVRARGLCLLPGFVSFIWKNIRHHLKPPMSMFVVLLGPDGVGKSTIGDLVAQRLYHRPFKVCRRFEHTFRLLPELKRIRAAAARLFGREVPVQAPPPPGTRGSGMNKEHGALRAMLYIIYYSLDLFMGRFVLRRLRGQGGAIIFARYYQDYYYQKGYSRAPRWFLRLLEIAVPTPDLILYLDRSAQDIYSAKPELDLMEIQRQQSVIVALLQGRENARIVDASRGIEATVQAVENEVVSRWLALAGVAARPA